MRWPGAVPTSARAATLAVAVVALLAGCDGDAGERPAPVASATGDGAVLPWALARRPTEFDPLLARTREELLVTRQVHEPLVSSLTGPFGDTRRLPGLSLRASPARDHTVWSFRLRPGVRFQDGSRLNAGAVLANGRRWLTTPEGRQLMPGLFAVDAPRPDLVRFLLEEPDRRFPSALSSPRTGIVSPRAFTNPSGEGAALRRENGTGTGAFELRERTAAHVLLVRNLAWWGAKRDLGPALDQVRFAVVATADARLALLAAGDVQVADGLRPRQAETVRRDPLLEWLPGLGQRGLGLERSVRGVDSAREIPYLAGVWLTRLGSG